MSALLIILVAPLGWMIGHGQQLFSKSDDVSLSSATSNGSSKERIALLRDQRPKPLDTIALARKATKAARKHLARVQEEKEIAEAFAKKLNAQLLAARKAGEQSKRAIQEFQSRSKRAQKEKEIAVAAAEDLKAQLLAARKSGDVIKRAAQEAQNKLARMAVESEETKLSVKETKAQLLAARTAENVAERATRAARAQLAGVQKEKEVAEASAQDLKAQLLAAREADEMTKRVVQETQHRLARVREEKEAAVRAVKEVRAQFPAIRQREASVREVSTELLSSWALEEKARLKVMDLLAEATREAKTVRASNQLPGQSKYKGGGGDDKQISRPTSQCVLAVQGKIPVRYMGSNTWDAAGLSRLCRGAEASVEPAKCFSRLIGGHVSWGASSIWARSNAIALCAGTRRAGKTIRCFVNGLARGQIWQDSIARCRAPKWAHHTKSVIQTRTARKELRTKF